MQKFFIKLIIEIGLRQEQKFLRLLAKIEYGVSIFCKKLSQLAYNEKHYNLLTLLQTHAKEEAHHGKMLATLADGVDRISLEESSGRWVSMVKLSDGEDIARYNPDKLTIKSKPITWESTKFPGDKLVGEFENLDGLSKRYYSLRLLFGGKSAEDFTWADRLAFMHALEGATKIFYEILSTVTKSSSLQAIALQIANDEQEHANYLYYSLFGFSPVPEADIQYWESRITKAMWGLIIDIWRNM